MDFKNNKEFDSIHTKFGHGNYISTKNLIEAGHKKIDFVGGYADIKITERRRIPKLTTVTSNGVDFGINAFEMMYERIEGIYTGPVRDREIFRSMVIRDSVKRI